VSDKEKSTGTIDSVRFRHERRLVSMAKKPPIKNGGGEGAWLQKAKRLKYEPGTDMFVYTNGPLALRIGYGY
jgi:hypothetical protein